ncbi:MAG: type II secretion system F family protein [Rhodoblastus sp.]|nr:type II secretion system F family protein [Rhodoblastus sp.]
MPDFIDPLWILSISVFGLAVIVAESAYRLYYEAGRWSRVSRRLHIGRQKSAEDAPVTLRRGRRLPGDRTGLFDFGWARRLYTQSGINLKPITLMAACALSGAGLFVLLSFWLDPFVALGVGAAVIVLAPLLALYVLRKRRQGRFGDQFPEAIDIIVRSLRAGHPIGVAIKAVAQELPDPAGAEFAILQDEIAYGLDLETAMRNLANRVGQQDLPLFVTSISIQSQTGGNLTEVLDNLGGTIRARIKLHRKVRALSSEGRVSAIILGAVPFILFGAVNVISPTFYGAYWGHPWIKVGLTGAIVWMCIGFAIMRKMINFRS